jgi:predicted metal-dependent phosphoesterase TrpH
MLRTISGMLVLLGIVSGTLSDSAQSPSRNERGGYEVIEADFHVHSHFGDGILSPFSLVLQARRQGLQAIAITDHNQIFGARCARWFSKLIGGPTVLVGEEITAPAFHLIAVGLNERVTWRQSPSDAIREIHRQGGVAIAGHPGRKYWTAYDDVIQELDGTEVMHPVAYTSGERGKEIREFYRRADASGRNLTAVGSSDYHWFNSLGLCRTFVFVRNNDEREILNALREGRTVVYDAEGTAYGKPELVRLVQEQPVKRDVRDYDYAGSGILDRVTRSFGWLGLIGLVLCGRRESFLNNAKAVAPSK